MAVAVRPSRHQSLGSSRRLHRPDDSAAAACARPSARTGHTSRGLRRSGCAGTARRGDRFRGRRSGTAFARHARKRSGTPVVSEHRACSGCRRRGARRRRCQHAARRCRHRRVRVGAGALARWPVRGARSADPAGDGLAAREFATGLRTRHGITRSEARPGRDGTARRSGIPARRDAWHETGCPACSDLSHDPPRSACCAPRGDGLGT